MTVIVNGNWTLSAGCARANSEFFDMQFKLNTFYGTIADLKFVGLWAKIQTIPDFVFAISVDIPIASIYISDRVQLASLESVFTNDLMIKIGDRKAPLIQMNTTLDWHGKRGMNISGWGSNNLVLDEKVFDDNVGSTIAFNYFWDRSMILDRQQGPIYFDLSESQYLGSSPRASISAIMYTDFSAANDWSLKVEKLLLNILTDSGGGGDNMYFISVFVNTTFSLLASWVASVTIIPLLASKGVSLGNFLIKRVASYLKEEFPSLKNFVTLSPLPGFMDWVIAGANTCRSSAPP
jgi:hypothetical protein